MNILFLDIDGVLNSDFWYKKQPPNSTSNNSLAQHLDKQAIALLNKIVRKTQAKIVLSTTWRLHYSLETLQTILENCGFIGELIGKTPDLVSLHSSFVRGNEILQWCKDNEAVIGGKYQNFKSYVILDDKDDMLYWQRKNFFQIDRYAGLTPSKVSAVIRFLE